MGKEKVLVSWSGGKDSSLALYEIQKNESYLINFFNSVISCITPEEEGHSMRPLNDAKKSVKGTVKSALFISTFLSIA